MSGMTTMGWHFPIFTDKL